MLSTARIVNEQEAPLSVLSTATQMTSVIPSGNELPDNSLHSTELMPELSTAEKLQIATAVALFPLVGLIVKGFAGE